MRRFLSIRVALLSTMLAVSPHLAPAQQPSNESAAGNGTAAPSEAHGRLLLVLPFTNRTGQTNLDWIGESFPEVLNTRLAAAGFLPISREDRLYALDHLGLPLTFQPSRASTLRIAQTLDADYVVVGSYFMSGNQIKATARILDVTSLTLGTPLDEQADLLHLLDVDNSLAWRVARTLDPAYSVAETTFLAADANLGVDAFENYIRGLVESAVDERIKHLKEAVRIDPDFPRAWFALGKLYFADQQYEDAANALGRLPKDDPNALDADFYRGMAYFNTGNYLKAEDAFAFVTTRQPLPEVVNNQGVAASRHGKDGTPLFEQAIAADPKDADYRFNLAVSLRSRNDIAGAVREIEQELKLRPEDTEAQEFDAALKAEKPGTPFTPGGGPGEPLERIKRTYNEASFRQAAFALDQVQGMRLASLAPTARAAALDNDGIQFLNRGLMLEAERQFNSALQSDPSNADAHAGLAQVRERSSDADAARTEALQSLSLRPNAAAHLVLARLDLQSNKLPVAATEVSEALKLEPANSAARGLRVALQARGQQVP